MRLALDALFIFLACVVHSASKPESADQAPTAPAAIQAMAPAIADDQSAPSAGITRAADVAATAETDAIRLSEAVTRPWKPWGQ
jgi:hypothetical protein